MDNVLYMIAVDNAGGLATSASIEHPVWEHVETRIKLAFEHGGSVALYSAIPIHKNNVAVELRWCIGMDSHPGACRLVYTPEQPPEEKNVRWEWWESGDAPFRGDTVFRDHKWDDRTVCRDQSSAIAVFRDFFDHGNLTEESLSQMRLTSNRKLRE